MKPTIFPASAEFSEILDVELNMDNLWVLAVAARPFLDRLWYWHCMVHLYSHIRAPKFWFQQKDISIRIWGEKNKFL